MAGPNDGGRLASREVLDVLDHLALKGLVVSEGSRFRFLESVRDFSAELLQGDEVYQHRRAHFEYFFRASENAEEKVRGPHQITWLQFFEVEWENVRAAMEWGLFDCEVSTRALLMLYNVTPYLYIKGAFAESIALYDVALGNLNSAPPDLKSRLFRRAGSMGIYHRDDRRQQWLLEAIQNAKEVGDESLIADALFVFGNSLFMSGKRDDAVPYFEESLAKFRALEDVLGMGFALSRLGAIAADRSEFDRSQSYLSECLDLRQEHGDTRGIGVSLALLADLELKRGRVNEAKSFILEGLSRILEVHADQDFVDSLSRASWIAMLHGDLEVAAKLMGYCDAHGSVRDPIDEADYLRVRNMLVDSLDPELLDRLSREGRGLTMHQVMDLVKQSLSGS